MDNEKNRTEKWENIVKIVYKNRKSVWELLTDDKLRVRMQFFCIFLIFSLVSAVMTVINVFSPWHRLMMSTMIFAFANVINMVLMMISQKTENLSRYLFSAEILALFAFFLITGEPEGFSAIWIALLPACGLLLYRIKYGIMLSVFQFAEVVFLFWTEAGRSLLMFRYTDSFLMRFPLLYIAFLFVGLFFEFTRRITQKELLEMRGRFEHLSKHDPLTGLFNRLGFYSDAEARIASGTNAGCALAVIDFDNFKTINDRFGHMNGDIVLKKSSEVISSLVGSSGSVCRWGGDELAVLFNSADAAEKLCGEILEVIRKMEFRFLQPEHITVSIGLTVVHSDAAFELADLIGAADNNLFNSKKNGKDRLNISEFVPSRRENDKDAISVMK